MDKKKIISYSLSALAGLLIASLVSIFAFKETLLYGFFFGLFGAGTAATIARTVLHLTEKDYSAEMWQISIYLFVVSAGWLGGVLSTTWGWVSLSLSVMSLGLLMAIGTRFVKRQSVSKSENDLEKSLRYRYINDTLGGALNLDYPLTLVVNGQALTVAEAEEKGYKAEAKKGREYIKKITGV